MNSQHRFLPRRPLGRTGFLATRLGIGDLADRSVGLEACVATARRAIEAGINVIDTAPAYEQGFSEQVVGQAVRGVRDSMFVIDKIDFHDQPVAPQVDGSLLRLGLNHVDLFLFHDVSTLEGWRGITAPDGGMDQLGRCVQAGKARFRGISSHNPAVLEQAIPTGLCDVVMFAVGAFCDERYYKTILPLARRHGVGTVCFKCFGAGKLLCDTAGYGRPLQQRPRGKLSSGGEPNVPLLPHLTVQQCVHYTLSFDPDVALLGMSFANEQDVAWSAAEGFRDPLSDQQLAEIRRQAAIAMEGKGPAWWNPPA